MCVFVFVSSGVPQAVLGPEGSTPLVKFQVSMFREKLRNDYGQGFVFFWFHFCPNWKETLRINVSSNTNNLVSIQGLSKYYYLPNKKNTNLAKHTSKMPENGTSTTQSFAGCPTW